jgi:hypothetical protein
VISVSTPATLCRAIAGTSTNPINLHAAHAVDALRVQGPLIDFRSLTLAYAQRGGIPPVDGWR